MAGARPHLRNAEGQLRRRRPSLWCKAPDGAQEAVVDSGAGRIFVPPYVGHKGWVGVYLDERVDWEGLSDLVEQSYRLIAPRQLVERLGG